MHKSSIFIVVDVLCTASYTVTEDELIFCSLLWIFSCVSADFSVSITNFFLSFAPGHLCITSVFSE